MCVVPTCGAYTPWAIPNTVNIYGEVLVPTSISVTNQMPSPSGSLGCSMSHTLEIPESAWVEISHKVYPWLMSVRLNDVPIYDFHKSSVLLDFEREEHRMEFVLTWL